MGRAKKPAALKANELVALKLTKSEKRKLEELGRKEGLGPSSLSARIIRDYLERPRRIRDRDRKLDAAKMQLVFDDVRPEVYPQILVACVDDLWDEEQFAAARKLLTGFRSFLPDANEVDAVVAWLKTGELSNASTASLAELFKTIRDNVRKRLDADSSPCASEVQS